MLTQERFNTILNLLEKKGAVTVQELSEVLGTSESTVRRDLNTLNEQGKLEKVHGGATLKKSDDGFVNTEDDFVTKSHLHSQEKENIAKYAASLIKDDDFIYLDAGTTTEKLIKYLPENIKATFVTNGIVHAKSLVRKGLRAFVIGGELKLITEAIIGVTAIEELNRYNFSKCFLGTNGISKANGFTTPDIDEAMIKNKAHEKSYVTYILADHSKFNRVFSVSFGEMSNSCIITDKLTDNSYKDLAVIKEVDGWFTQLPLTLQ